jgi:2-polyprenyl-3-methyl-5-hydroxy-6-metoxy-1,4-benzoquinol methylase
MLSLEKAVKPDGNGWETDPTSRHIEASNLLTLTASWVAAGTEPVAAEIGGEHVVVGWLPSDHYATRTARRNYCELDYPRDGGLSGGAMCAELYIGTELELFAQARNWKHYWGSIISPYLGERVLDVGAGLGETAKLLATSRQSKWVCVEPDRQMAEQMTHRISAADLPAHCVAQIGTIDDVKDHDFSSALYIDVLEHIEDDRAELRKAADHVQFGGCVIVLAPAHQWLYSPFDRVIGHFRRYALLELCALAPQQLAVERAIYLDSVGFFASLANRVAIRAGMPTAAQIRFWDKIMVPASRIVDPLLLRQFGKTALIIWRKR